MTVSVIIPVFNGSRTIRATLDSVLRQTLSPDEVLVMDDGSTDDTFSLLQPYAPRVTVFRQDNQGVAAARNALCARATGDLIAFLDSDDLWHPRYIEEQQRRLIEHPHAVASFAGHVDIYDYAGYEWESSPSDADIEVLDPLAFFRRLDSKSGFFLPSSFCIPRRVLGHVGGRAFPEHLSGVDDLYFYLQLALLGPVVIAPFPLVAYRIRGGSISENTLRMCARAIECHENIEELYRSKGSMYAAFKNTVASKKRNYAKRLMGVGREDEARQYLASSLSNSRHPASLGKSLGLLLLSYVPSALQPKWPPAHRGEAGPVGPNIGSVRAR